MGASTIHILVFWRPLLCANMDWILRRVFTTLVKRYLGRVLKSQPDLDQVDVQLRTGKVVQLRSVLLNCDYLSEQLVSGGVG